MFRRVLCLSALIVLVVPVHGVVLTCSNTSSCTVMVPGTGTVNGVSATWSTCPKCCKTGIDSETSCLACVNALCPPPATTPPPTPAPTPPPTPPTPAPTPSPTPAPTPAPTPVPKVCWHSVNDPACASNPHESLDSNGDPCSGQGYHGCTTCSACCFSWFNSSSADGCGACWDSVCGGMYDPTPAPTPAPTPPAYTVVMGTGLGGMRTDDPGTKFAASTDIGWQRYFKEVITTRYLNNDTRGVWYDFREHGCAPQSQMYAYHCHHDRGASGWGAPTVHTQQHAIDGSPATGRNFTVRIGVRTLERLKDAKDFCASILTSAGEADFKEAFKAEIGSRTFSDGQNYLEDVNDFNRYDMTLATTCRVEGVTPTPTPVPTEAPTPAPTPTWWWEHGQSFPCWRECWVVSAIWGAIAILFAMVPWDGNMCWHAIGATVFTLSGLLTGILYWPAVIGLPMSYWADITPTGGVPYCSHGMFLVVCTCQTAFQLLAISRWGEGTRRNRKNLAQLAGNCVCCVPVVTVIHLITSVLARLDTYTDLCFVLIARKCGEEYADIALGVFVVGTLFGHFLPYLAYVWELACSMHAGDDWRCHFGMHCIPAAGGTEKDSEKRVLNARYHDLHLICELAACDVANPQDLNKGMWPQWFRCIIEGVVMAVLQLLWLRDNPSGTSAYSLVLWSVTTSFIMLFYAVVRTCCVCTNDIKGMSSRRSSRKADQTTTPQPAGQVQLAVTKEPHTNV